MCENERGAPRCKQAHNPGNSIVLVEMGFVELSHRRKGRMKLTPDDGEGAGLTSGDNPHA